MTATAQPIKPAPPKCVAPLALKGQVGPVHLHSQLADGTGTLHVGAKCFVRACLWCKEREGVILTRGVYICTACTVEDMKGRIDL